MLALRTLLGLRWAGTPEFWREQAASVGARWPGLVFHGLAEHGLQLAAAELPDLIRDAKGMREVLDHFPGLLRDLGIGVGKVKEACLPILPKLPHEAEAELRKWLTDREAPLPERHHAELWAALEKRLDGDIGPRTRHSTLGGFELSAA